MSIGHAPHRIKSFRRFDRVSTGETTQEPDRGITSAELAAAKGLPYAFLREQFQLMDDSRRQAVQIPYRGSNRQYLFSRWRNGLTGGAEPHTKQPKDTPLQCYGLWRLDEFREGGRLIVAEGETDLWSGWFHGLPILSVPGANAVGKCLESCLPLLTGFTEVLVWQEPDGGGEHFVSRAGPVLARVPGLTVRIISGATAGVKDVSALHMANPDPVAFRAAFDAILAAAGPMPVAEVSRVSTPVADPYRGDDDPGCAPLDIRIARCVRYLERLPASVAGQGGHAALMAAARATFKLGLNREAAVHALREHFNPRCQPEWSDHDLKHKVDDAWNTARTAFGSALVQDRDDYRPRRSEMDGMGANTDPDVFERLSAPMSATVAAADLSDLAGPRVIVPAPEPPVPVRHEPTDPIPAAFAPPVCRCQNPCSVSLKGKAGGRHEGSRAVIDVRGKGWQCCPDCYRWNQARWATWLRRVASWWASPERAAAAGIVRPPAVPDQPHELHVAAIKPAEWGRVKKWLDRCEGLYATVTTVGGCVDVPSLLLREKEEESGDSPCDLFVLAAVPAGKRLPDGLTIVSLDTAVRLTNAALEHVVRDLPEGRRVSASRPWSLSRADEADVEREADEKQWERDAQSAYTAAECQQIDAELGIAIPLEIHHENVQATAVRSDDLAGGPLAGWFVGRLRERNKDGGRRSREFIVRQFRLWRSILVGVGDGPAAREFMNGRLDASPDIDDPIRLRLAADRDRREAAQHETIPAEYRGLKFDRAIRRNLYSFPDAAAC